MNIDFHYGVIYIVGRTAGLTRNEAQTVAHACQYVDDATTDGLLKFRDGQRFERFASAHGMIDYRNRVSENNRESWVPFHFVPGGEGDSFDDRLVCRPNSAIAKARFGEATKVLAIESCVQVIGIIERHLAGCAESSRQRGLVPERVLRTIRVGRPQRAVD